MSSGKDLFEDTFGGELQNFAISCYRDEEFRPTECTATTVGPTPSRQINLFCDPSAGVEEVDKIMRLPVGC